MKSVRVIAAVVVVVMVLAVGEMDYQDALAEQAHACEMVKAGLWPAAVVEGGCRGND